LYYGGKGSATKAHVKGYGPPLVRPERKPITRHKEGGGGIKSKRIY